MTEYNKRDASRDVKSPEKEVSRAWHQARDDAKARSPEPDDRPTAQNARDARRLEQRVLKRARERERSR
ncbi:MAG: hypothetical protein M3340_01845 [Actinomycetota bacterium]|nr:hypothetical protein [Actinomycetota bacterium]